MKNIKTITAIILIAVLSACENKDINPSSNITIQERTINDYSGIRIATAFEVELTISDTEEKIEIEANENLHAYIDVIKSGDDLLIKLKDNTDIQGTATLKARITTSNPLSKITVQDASAFVMKNDLVTDDILLTVDDASVMNAKISASNAEVRVSDASSLTLTGYIDDMDLYVYDASQLNGLEMIVKDVLCRLEDGSHASLTVNETIDLEAEGASSFSYRGDAVVTNLDLSDASQIIKLD